MHKMDNVLSYIPTKQQEQVKPELRALFYQKDRQAADQAVAAFIEKYQKVYPSAIECLQRDLEACLTFYAFPKDHWKTIRTNNIMERLFFLLLLPGLCFWQSFRYSLFRLYCQFSHRNPFHVFLLLYCRLLHLLVYALLYFRANLDQLCSYFLLIPSEH
jgi:hypothetical protein